ncbi:uncharacterized protein [Dermacentor albipictus]|uniref:uncharacterized protein n=1 Tax=Dermacentor albipictus TaxID=60249 RepID=UPI0038FC0A15
MAPSAALKFSTRSRMPRHPHARRQRRINRVRRPVSLGIRRRAGGAAQRASTDQLSVRLPGRHKDCSRSPRRVFQRKCRYDAMSGCAVGTAAAPGNCSLLPCFCLRYERLRACRALLRKLTKHRRRLYAGGVTQRASTDQFSLRLPGCHKDCGRSPGHVCQRNCHHDAMSGCPLGSAGAAGGNSSILPCIWLRLESPCPCRVMASRVSSFAISGSSCAAVKPGPPVRGRRWGRRLCCWARPAGATRSPEMALTTAPIVPLLSKPSPRWLPSKCPDLPACCPSATLRWLLDAGESHAAAPPRAALASPRALHAAAAAPPAIQYCRAGSRGLLVPQKDGHQPTSFLSGCPGATRTVAGLLATSASATATMTPCRAALWDQQEQQPATPASCRASGSGSKVPAPAE